MLTTALSDLRSATNAGQSVTKEEQVLGDKAVGGIDNDKDHVPNVEGGLKAYVSSSAGFDARETSS